MAQPWIYRVGLSKDEVSRDALTKSGLKFDEVEVESALREAIPTTLGKKYKFNTSMRQDAPEHFSCSSIVSYLYMFAGVWLPSLSIDKYFYTKRIDKSELRFGDLVFAYNEDDSGGEEHLRNTSVEYMPGQLKVDEPINHMGMYLGDGMVLQAAGLWYKGEVIEEELDVSPSFKNIRGYGRVVDNLKERRYVVEIPEDKPELRKRDALIEYVNQYANR